MRRKPKAGASRCDSKSERAATAGTGLLIGLIFVCCAVHAQEFSAPLPIEPTDAVANIATPYPASYAMVHDFAFGSLIDSAFALVDAASGRFKGMISAGNFATLDVSSARQEFYVGESYYSRGTRGERVDLVSVYDMDNLDRLAEIELPKKRAAVVVNKGATAITDSGRFLLVFNLTPGTSVSVVDLEARAFVGEIQTPGCSLVYPTKIHNFFMLCGDGALLNVSLNDDGGVLSRAKSAPFIDIDADPLSEKSSKVGDTWQFISFRGDVQPIDDEGRPGERWSLTATDERAANWRPAGWHWTAGHPDGLLWVGMTPNGYDGSHKDPASEVWLYDVAEQERLQRIRLKTIALSIDVTLEEKPRLLVVNAEGALDIYDARSGDYQRSIYDLGASPYQVHAMP
ncbi:MAG: amine dehydrogenase large subunit [Pseudomonadales bacterium]|jgi:methylamine dehydrogenase heavy chain|nr:amine dehydrogenase large subunit [Pseudomonadales bacterium]MDP6469755.1 amine dehydrogenase large subunit [Pseudomonadales bacterium]MDP6827643.1 amine dehydrogenase large subunit [Pseudomonadales bacterium]MDP6971916.1 amine dehydrogenase large subunit [Pseudomonadales bacterium]|tara:strand:- start:63 stop:1262 length:1200 start_codon:yes stop_codon:yes gene_type:complete